MHNDTDEISRLFQEEHNKKVAAQWNAEQAQNAYHEFLKTGPERDRAHYMHVQKIDKEIKEIPSYRIAATAASAQKEYDTTEREYQNLIQTINFYESYLSSHHKDSREFYQYKKALYEAYQQRDLLKNTLTLKKYRLTKFNNVLAVHLRPYQDAYHNFFRINKHQALAVIQNRAHQYAQSLNNYSHQKSVLLQKEQQLLHKKDQLAQKYTSWLGKARKGLGGGRELRRVSKELAECQHRTYALRRSSAKSTI